MIDDPHIVLQASLRQLGFLRANEAAHLTALTGGVSADVFRADLPDGRRVVVKRPLQRLRVAEEWLAPSPRAAAEACWLRFARRVDARFAPEVLAEDRAHQVMVLEWLDPANHPVWKDRLAAGEIVPAFASNVGRALARLHAASVADLREAAAFDDPAAFFELRISPFLLWPASRHPSVADRLEALADRLSQTRTAIIHGDVSPKNILIGPEAPVFLDAETCTRGDPAFDLAFCLTHLLLKSVWLKPFHAALEQSFDALADGYLRAVEWEPRSAVSSRAGALVAALLLARVDGKSPAPYLTAPEDKDFVRRAALEFLGRGDLSIQEVATLWRSRWRAAFF